LIVRAKPGLSMHKRGQLLAARGAHVRAQMPQIGATAIEVSGSQMGRVTAELRRSGAFLSVEEDGTAHGTAVPNDPLFAEQWGLAWINAVPSWTMTEGSPDDLVAVLDTGVDPSHPDLWGQVLPGYDFVNDDSNPFDDHGHGTMMAGIVASLSNNGVGVVGVAPQTRILPVKVLDQSAAGYYSTIIAGILYATDAGARVINLSLAGTVPSEAMQSAVDYATSRDVVVVASAGNEGTSEPRYPAASAGVIAVAATDADDTRASFSNYGDWVTVAAPGVAIYGPHLQGRYAAAFGTSAAAALTSGALALVRAGYPAESADEVTERLLATTADLGVPGPDVDFGFGLVDAFAALTATIFREPTPTGGDPTPTPAEPTPTPSSPSTPLPTATPVPSSPASAEYSLPVVKLANPASGDLVYGLVPVDVVSSDDSSISRVDLQVDGRTYATADAPPFSFVWDTEGLDPGGHFLRASAYDVLGNRLSTRRRRVYVTPGVGLLVKRGTVRFGRRPGKDTLSITSIFTLPEGAVFDPFADRLDIELSTATEVVTAVSVASGGLQRRRSTLKFSGAVDVPASGKIQVKIKPTPQGNVYMLNISGRLLDLSAVDTEMELRVVLGSSLLWQSLVFRDKGSSLSVP
jgi:type VII secretion-associated serine protease mycosin